MFSETPATVEPKLKKTEGELSLAITFSLMPGSVLNAENSDEPQSAQYQVHTGAGKLTLPMAFSEMPGASKVEIPKEITLNLGSTETQAIEAAPVYQELDPQAQADQFLNYVKNAQGAVIKTHEYLEECMERLKEHMTALQEYTEALPVLLARRQQVESGDVVRGLENVSMRDNVTEDAPPDDDEKESSTSSVISSPSKQQAFKEPAQDVSDESSDSEDETPIAQVTGETKQDPTNFDEEVTVTSPASQAAASSVVTEVAEAPEAPETLETPTEVEQEAIFSLDVGETVESTATETAAPLLQEEQVPTTSSTPPAPKPPGTSRQQKKKSKAAPKVGPVDDDEDVFAHLQGSAPPPEPVEPEEWEIKTKINTLSPKIIMFIREMDDQRALGQRSPFRGEHLNNIFGYGSTLFYNQNINKTRDVQRFLESRVKVFRTGTPKHILYSTLLKLFIKNPNGHVQQVPCYLESKKNKMQNLTRVEDQFEPELDRLISDLLNVRLEKYLRCQERRVNRLPAASGDADIFNWTKQLKQPYEFTANAPSFLNSKVFKYAMNYSEGNAYSRDEGAYTFIYFSHLAKNPNNKAIIDSDFAFFDKYSANYKSVETEYFLSLFEIWKD